MAKATERILAKELYMKGRQQKEIAEIVHVQEKTVSDWVAKGGWRGERDARINGAKAQVDNIKKIIGQITNERVDLIDQMAKAEAANDNTLFQELNDRASKIADEVSKYNKALLTLEKENKITLSTYIDVMDDIFTAVKNYDPKIYLKLLDFQEQHLSDISIKLS